VTPAVHGADDIGPARLTRVSGVPIPRTEDGKPPQRILHAVAVDQQIALLDGACVAVHGLIEGWLKGRKQALEVFAPRGRSEIGDHGVGERDRVVIVPARRARADGVGVRKWPAGVIGARVGDL
jgi:hypothetical protein